MFDKILGILISLAALYLLAEAIYRRFIKKEPTVEIPPEPVKHCQVYLAVGCAHVDGYLCDMRTCDVDVIVQFRPKFQRIVNNEVL